VFFLFTALPKDKVQSFCTSALHRAVVPCDSTAFLFLYQLFSIDYRVTSAPAIRTLKTDTVELTDTLRTLLLLHHCITMYQSLHIPNAFDVRKPRMKGAVHTVFSLKSQRRSRCICTKSRYQPIRFSSQVHHRKQFCPKAV